SRNPRRQALIALFSRNATAAAIVAMCVISAAAQQPAPQATAQPRGAFAPLPGVRLWFTDTGGSGEPIVLMHAITGISESWVPQIEAFSKAGYRVIAFDRRG